MIVSLAGLTSPDTATIVIKQKVHAAHGRVTQVAADGTSFTVQIQPHKKKNAPAPATPPVTVEKKFTIDKNTKIEFVRGKKGERVFTPAAVSDIHKGEHVIVHMRPGQSEVVDRVAIVKHKSQL
jgi:hypothetical protein